MNDKLIQLSQPISPVWTGSAIAIGLALIGMVVGVGNSAAAITIYPPVQQADDARAEQDSELQDGSIVPEIPLRAWELHPYQVLVWMCHNGSPRLNAVYDSIVDDVLQRSELIDPSGWRVFVQQAPFTWRNRLLRSIDQPVDLTGIEGSPELANADKLIVVCLEDHLGQTAIQVREFDIQTQQWGPVVNRQTAQIDALGETVFRAISKAFMPIARVDRVSDSGEVLMRARAVDSCVKAVQDDEGEWVLETIASSPVWVRPDDRFLPIIRRVDRQGNLAKLEAIDFTFLTLEKQEGFQLTGRIHSYHRAPLSGRTSRRAQKLALVIRPPENPTELRLLSSQGESEPLAGYEILSRRPGMGRDESSEFLGTTDWRGVLEIPPHPDGLRLIYVKRGNRFLKKLPIIPGLYEFLETTVPDDRTRLYAQGIIAGFQNEILNLVAQRQVYEVEIERNIDSQEFKLASDLLQKYQNLPSPQDLKNRMADEETSLKAQTTDRRELEYISRMFAGLRDALNSGVADSREPALRARLQTAREGSATQ